MSNQAPCNKTAFVKSGVLNLKGQLCKVQIWWQVRYLHRRQLHGNAGAPDVKQRLQGFTSKLRFGSRETSWIQHARSEGERSTLEQSSGVASQLHWHAWDVKQGTWLWACGARDWLLESKRSQYQTWVAKAMQQALCTRKNHQRKKYSNDLTPKNIREMFRQSEHCEKHRTIWAIHPLCKKMISIRETRKQKSTMKSNANGFSVCTLKKKHRQRHFNYWFQNFAKNLYGENYFLHTSKKKKLHDMVQEWWTSRHVFLTNGGLLCSDQHQKRLIPHNQTNFRWNMTWDPLHQLNHQLFGNCHWNEADGRNEGYQKTKVICSWDV